MPLGLWFHQWQQLVRGTYEQQHPSGLQRQGAAAEHPGMTPCSTPVHRGRPGPDRYNDPATLHGVERLVASAGDVAILLGLVAYWQLRIRRDEPPRIRSRWDRRRG